MPVNLSIKNTPDAIVERLRDRAARHHRSLQGELLAILEEAVSGPERRTPLDVLVQVRKLNLPRGVDSTAIVRTDRDRR
ncbi:MAG: Arc family DNA-binding protein [Acetobacteraceae bacterium]|nr:Arc family DNA-binding protein [Acetobacteraceae bacterium]MBV8592023.1 Arc family DNA-binding protein [Acetobacteraceae bacterium]